MRRIGIGVAALAMMLAACGPTAAAPVAQSSPEEGSTIINTISVSGTGEVAGVPDTLIVDLGVSLMRSSVDQATRDAADLASGVIDAVRSAGVEERDIRTTNYSIWPEYDYRNDQQTLRGYRVTNTISIKIRDLDAAGAVIDAATAAGGDEAVVNGIRFDIEDNGALVVAAREAAWNDAFAKAQQLASLAGLELGSAVSISESTTSAPPIYYDRAYGLAESGDATPIQPGEQQVSVTITVSFAVGS